MEKTIARDLIDFIYKSPTAFHAVETTKSRLLDKGFKELQEYEAWKLEKNGKYFVTKNSSAIIAFVIGDGEIEEDGFKIIGAHTDSPGFRLKPNPEVLAEGKYIKLNTEVYGGPILSTWFDRPLSLAGRVALRSNNPLFPEMKLVNINKPLLIIPNLAIHMNRDINEGFKINRQKDCLPLLGLLSQKLEKENYILKLIAEELKVKEEDIIDFDLFPYEYEKGCLMGINEEFISSSRLDDLSMVHAGLEAITNTKVNKATNILVCFDNEEVGSATKQGADSSLLASLLERILVSQGKGREDFFRALSKSFLISADLAHAVHPNVSEKHDPVIRPILNGGPVIKIAASQSYTTDSDSLAVYEEICKRANVPVQKFVNRSDLRGGSTIGPISSTHLNIRSVDMGTPILGMHSIRELGAVKDHYYVIKSFEEFYKL
ncbi:aspartyl aminopeptidase [Clostridium cavendishii DSM 21758]|uniref:Probable M18 family aminopeptidase 2 n=1 Tax=Clostridium cavendishii DSM 21758 TaxID=1121302 RepID=A0A1M6QIZ4_9CLOT|nr:M18 family aminopeptidase [Clostridium cavendishii]SHK20249.1 aspartyl aminopeptidase [Clostridium cavendishii DSM 21758]